MWRNQDGTQAITPKPNELKEYDIKNVKELKRKNTNVLYELELINNYVYYEIESDTSKTIRWTENGQKHQGWLVTYPEKSTKKIYVVLENDRLKSFSFTDYNF